jgi:hypothetical protein
MLTQGIEPTCLFANRDEVTDLNSRKFWELNTDQVRLKVYLSASQPGASTYFIHVLS